MVDDLPLSRIERAYRWVAYARPYEGSEVLDSNDRINMFRSETGFDLSASSKRLAVSDEERPERLFIIGV